MRRASAELRKLIFVYLTLLYTFGEEVPSRGVPSSGMRLASAEVRKLIFVFNPIVHIWRRGSIGECSILRDEAGISRGESAHFCFNPIVHT
jgi:hypothetical protein